jgi:hypothetical protein
MKSIFVFILLITASIQKASAYMTVAESGELVPENQFRVSIEPQVNYFDFSGHFDTGVAEDAQVRVSAGMGSTGYHFDFFYKRIPYPDYDDQPAIGYKFGASFARESNSSVVTPIFYPLISKNIIIKKDRWTPYASLPIGVSVFQSRSSTPIRFVAGVEYVPTSVENMQFGGEIGFNVKDSFSYASGYVSFYFEPSEQVIDNN